MRKGFLLPQEEPPSKKSRSHDPFTVHAAPSLKIFEKLVELPDELILVMCTFLNLRDLCSFSLTAKRCREIAESNVLWFNFAAQRWGQHRPVKKDVLQYDGRFRDLLKDANAKNLFYFDKGLCEAATLSDDKLTASIEGCSDDCILLTHRGMTSGCYTFRVRIHGKSESYPIFLGLGAFVRATIGITYNSISVERWRVEYLIAYYLADMILHDAISHSQVEARSNLDPKGIAYGDTVAAVVNLVDAENNTIRFYHNDKPIGEEGFVRFKRDDPTMPIYFFFRLGDGESQTAELLHGEELPP